LDANVEIRAAQAYDDRCYNPLPIDKKLGDKGLEVKTAFFFFDCVGVIQFVVHTIYIKGG
jgi:hypothetical protein